MIGTGDQFCWLAEACKIVLVLLLKSVAEEAEEGAEEEGLPDRAAPEPEHDVIISPC